MPYQASLRIRLVAASKPICRPRASKAPVVGARHSGFVDHVLLVLHELCTAAALNRSEEDTG